MEEDETPKDAIVAGRIAYSKEIETQLNSLITERIQTGNTSSLTDQEKKAISDAVGTKVRKAIRDRLSFGEMLFDDQDDDLGFTHAAFIDGDISYKFFDFPEIKNGNDSSNRFVLSGNLFLGPIPTEPVELCKPQRSKVKAKKEEIRSLNNRVSSLQSQLQTATPQQKPAIVSQIRALDTLITEAESLLQRLEAELDRCMSRPVIGGGADVNGGVIVEPM